MRLLLIGCTGLVGRGLIPLLQAAGHQLTLVSRRSSPAALPPEVAKSLQWIQADPAAASSWAPSMPLHDALAASDGVVNLAGEPIAEQRWSVQHLEKLEASRLCTTSHLVSAMATLAEPPSVLVNASAVGYFGTSLDERFEESSPAGDDFLARLCQKWEQAAAQKPSATRLVVLRIGIVLSSEGGALAKMLPVFRAGFGGPIGSGQQWMSWIERGDLCRIIQSSLESESWSGVVNAVAPDPVTMAVFAGSLGRCLGRPSLLPVPGPMLQLLLGDGAKVVLEGQFVSSTRLDALGFTFRCPTLPVALDVATSSSNR
tara:strand:+ start:1472 stop:2416 length:945 start_codon:yes stop_codon:yes gene_type:complete